MCTKQKESTPMNSVSSRAEPFIAFGSNPNAYGKIHALLLKDVYEAESNTEGAILMSVSENMLCNDIVLNRIKEHSPFDSSVLHYAFSTGKDAFKAAMADCLTNFVLRIPSEERGLVQIRPDQLAISAGCTALLYQLSTFLFEHGDSVLIPAPYYASFDRDLGCQGGVSIIPVQPGDLAQYTLTESNLDAAYNTGIKEGKPPKALLLTNPHNPVGKVYSASELQLAVDWCRRRRLHLICDEIYALSVFDPSVEGPFQSITSLLNNQIGDFVHVLWGVSKDLGASGLRAGVLYTHNVALLAAISASNIGYQVSGFTQAILTYILADHSFLQLLQRENCARIQHSYRLLTSGLDRLQIPYRHVGAGIFVFIDLRGLLRQDSFEGERELHQALAREIKWSLTPGEACHHPVPGFFRACYCWVSAAAIDECLRRLEGFIATWRA